MLGYGAVDAIGASLFADTVASLVVSWTYYQAGNVNLRQGWWIAVGSVLGAQVGSYISPHIAESSLGGSFGIFLIITAVVFALRGMGTVIPISGQPTETKREPNKLLKLLRKNVVLSSLILGFLVGIISGLLGAGGGVMILLILVFVLEYSMHEGVGTSTFIMAFTAASGAIGHALTGNLPLELKARGCTVIFPPSLRCRRQFVQAVLLQPVSQGSRGNAIAFCYENLF